MPQTKRLNGECPYFCSCFLFPYTATAVGSVLDILSWKGVMTQSVCSLGAFALT